MFGYLPSPVIVQFFYYGRDSFERESRRFLTIIKYSLLKWWDLDKCFLTLNSLSLYECANWKSIFLFLLNYFEVNFFALRIYMTRIILFMMTIYWELTKDWFFPSHPTCIIITRILFSNICNRPETTRTNNKNKWQ